MLDLTLWEERLNAAQTDLKKIGSAADVPSAIRELKQDPAAFFVPAADRGGANPFGNTVRQTVGTQVEVLIGIKHAGARSGKKNVIQLKDVRIQIRDTLLGWQPGDAAEQVEYVGGRRFRFTDQVLWWIDIYKTSYDIRSK